MNASDWPSGDNAMAERKGRALGNSSVARDLARRRHANEHARNGGGALLPCQAPGAKRGKGRCRPRWRTQRRAPIASSPHVRSGLALRHQPERRARPQSRCAGWLRPASGGAVPCSGNAAAACGFPVAWLTAGDRSRVLPGRSEPSVSVRTVSFEWDPAGEHFVQDAPKGPDVGGPRDRGAPSPAPATYRLRCRRWCRPR